MGFLLFFTLFITVPVVELWLLVAVVGPQLGVPYTVALVLGTGVLGAGLVRIAGARVWREFLQALEAGRLPGDELLAGVATLVGAAFLLTPGILTDVVGVCLLFKPTQLVIVALMRRTLISRMSMTVHGVDVTGEQMFGGDIPPGQMPGPFGPPPGHPPADGGIKEVEIRQVDE